MSIIVVHDFDKIYALDFSALRRDISPYRRQPPSTCRMKRGAAEREHTERYARRSCSLLYLDYARA